MVCESVCQCVCACVCVGESVRSYALLSHDASKSDFQLLDFVFRALQQLLVP